MINTYHIEGTSNIHPYDISHPAYNTPDTWPTFQNDFIRFKKIITNSVINKESKLFLRVADGEFLFLKGISEGNIPRRHLSKNINSFDITPFREGVLKADYIMTQLYTEWINEFKNVIPQRPIDFPMEFAYSIVANRWIFKEFKGTIGIIGGESKIRTIKELFKHQQYRDYIGRDNFDNYISIPEYYACDNIDENEQVIGQKLKTSNCDIYLFGIGISKLALAHRFKKYNNGVFIDVGCGISALAGTTSLQRPYFGSWTNFKLKNFNYVGFDPMDYSETAGMNEIILGE